MKRIPASFESLAAISCFVFAVACGGRLATTVDDGSEGRPRPGTPDTVPVSPITAPSTEPGAEPRPDEVPPGVTKGQVVVSELGGCAYSVAITDAVFDVDVPLLLGKPQCAANVTISIASGAIVAARSSKQAALTIRGLAPGSRVSITNNGRIVGAGGAGGAGGNGGSGGQPRNCGRPGEAGGTAVRVEVPTTFTVLGEIFGGGGGGAGASGGNEALGGGGGAGLIAGVGGAPATTLSEADELAYCGQDNGIRSGTPGLAGTLDRAGGSRGAGFPSCRSGAGGGPGLPGQSSNCYGNAPGGAGGAAIEITGSGTVNVQEGAYAGGVGPIRGAVVSR